MSDNSIKNLPIEQISALTAADDIRKQNHLTTMLQGIYENQERLERATIPVRAIQEQAERLMLPIKQVHDDFERITQAIANPFGKSFTANATAPMAIEHKPPMPHHHNSPALRTLASVETAKNNENEKNLKIENQILLKIVERLAEKPANETRATLAEMPLIANTLALQANEIASLKAQLEQKEQEINELQAKINQLQATATPANDDVELTGTRKKAVTKLLYALLREHNYSIDGTTTKGATNQILENLTINHNVGVSRETIANWLAEINTLHYNTNK